MTKRHFTSDPHIGHKLVSVLRMIPEGPHIVDSGRGADLTLLDPEVIEKAVEDHARIYAENWDRVVGPDDTVYVLGDIAINPKRERVFDWFRERPGKKILIAGNHDEVAGFHSKGLNERQKPDWTETFAAISDFAFLKIQGRRVALSHYPYEGEGDRDIPDRLTEVRLRDVGVPLLHGHTHGKHQAHTSEAGTPMLHVGPDAWGLQLVPESTVIEWLDYLP